jgi:phage replication O-like protein O
MMIANPQLEDGYTIIANEIVEAFARINFSYYESRIVWTLLRRTYGWQKKEDRISISQFQKICGLDRRHISRTLLKLKRRKIVASRGTGHSITYGIQKDYLQWKNVASRGTPKNVASRGTPEDEERRLQRHSNVASRGTKSSPPEAHTNTIIQIKDLSSKRDVSSRGVGEKEEGKKISTEECGNPSKNQPSNSLFKEESQLQNPNPQTQIKKNLPPPTINKSQEELDKEQERKEFLHNQTKKILYL